MKRVLGIVFMLSILCACISSPSGSGAGPDDVLGNWARGLEGRDLDLLMSAYWPDAEMVIKNPDGPENVFNGIDEIRQQQQTTVIDNPESKISVWLELDEEKINSVTVIRTLTVQVEDFRVINIMTMEKRGRDWKIIQQTIEF